MFNVGGGEVLVILLIALLVLGPQKLPGVARQVGGFMREVRRVSTGFQQELKTALDDPVEEEARARGKKIVSTEQSPAPTADPEVSTAAAAGMYDIDEPDSADPTDDVPEAPEELSEPASSAEAAGMYDPEPPDPDSDTGIEE